MPPAGHRAEGGDEGDAARNGARTTEDEIEGFNTRGEKPVGVLAMFREMEAHILKVPEDFRQIAYEYLEDAAAPTASSLQAAAPDNDVRTDRRQAATPVKKSGFRPNDSALPDRCPRPGGQLRR